MPTLGRKKNRTEVYGHACKWDIQYPQMAVLIKRIMENHHYPLNSGSPTYFSQIHMQWSQRFFGILYRFLDDFHRPSAQIRFVSAGQHLRSGTTSPDIWFCDAKKMGSGQ